MTPQPNMACLHFELGSDHEACRRLLDQFIALGANPEQQPVVVDAPVRYRLSIPIRLKSELETYLRLALRLLDEMDVEPCHVELRHIIAHMSGDESLSFAEPANGTWNGMRTGYIAADPDVTELHHTVTAPKRGGRPPLSVSDLPGSSDAWFLTDPPGAWDFH